MPTWTEVPVDLLRNRVVNSTDLGELTGSTRRNVNRWTTGEAIHCREAEGPAEPQGRDGSDAATLRDEAARLWLRSPNPDLDWRKPLESAPSAGMRAPSVGPCARILWGQVDQVGEDTLQPTDRAAMAIRSS